MKLDATLERVRVANPASPVATESDALFNAIVAAPGDPRFGRDRRVPRARARLVLVAVVLFLAVAGTATATYLLTRGNGEITIEAGLGKLLVVNPNGPGLRAIAPCPRGSQDCAISGPVWSPDGTRVAFVRGHMGGPLIHKSHMFLYVAAPERGRTRRLAACGVCAIPVGGRLAWSPDGRWIAYSRDSGFSSQDSLWIVAAAGGKPRLLACHSSCSAVQPEWSPDGHTLVFERSNLSSGASGLYTVRPDGSGLTLVAENGAEPAWSPDGRRIAFDGKGGVEVVNGDGSHLRLLFAGAPATGPWAPAWSPDGRKLVFVTSPPRGGGFGAEIWTMKADGTDKTRLYRSGCCVDASPIWSPDGQQIAFSDSAPRGTFVINANGTGLRRLSPDVANTLSWQPLRKGQPK